MFFILSKTLHFLLMPIIWVVVLLLLAVFLKSPKWKRNSLLSALGLLLLFSNPLISNEAWRAWEIEAKPISEVDNYDVAVILTGVTSYREDVPDRIHTSKGSDRFLHPLQLYRMGKIDKILITGGSGYVLADRIPEAEQIEKILLMAGVAEEDILTESNSRNTRENATNTAAFLQKHPGFNKVLLVTSAFHMRRAAACFEKAGVKADSFTADFYGYERRFTPDELIIPNASAFNTWHVLIHEVAGYLIYKLLGYC
ncbi:YdcF family protein [Pontibacter aydingkolensis]|uniref:YdcF family protein n=2 Tax=Pontibacter aydingkolensis TaxID=1911536 RepID=A0ABS7CW18_9BACT|nr:YdcF family protein [Pontibacter aydingkolensis]